jgi:hypothetical protein
MKRELSHFPTPLGARRVWFKFLARQGEGVKPSLHPGHPTGGGLVQTRGIGARNEIAEWGRFWKPSDPITAIKLSRDRDCPL